jgi:pyridoxal phosphate enzyme (YggS family)
MHMQRAEHKRDDLSERLERVRARIAASARRVGRAPEEVKLIAVSKTQPAGALREALDAGALIFGENRVQEAEGKIEELKAGAQVIWHLIGHLQSNKARRAVKIFDCIQSVDSALLVERLERLCVEEGRESLDILLQLDLAGEATKTGASEDELPAMAAALQGCERLRCRGLMTLPPFFADADLVRPFFRRMRALRDELRGSGVFSGDEIELSMGMSHDFEIAIEEGATMVRVGTAIFGERHHTL